MAQNNKNNFIVIDDSKLDCFIAERIIKNTGRCESIISFLQAKDALEHISKTPASAPYPVIILVDIQMPVMNGFQFVAAFENLSDTIKNNYIIYLISSSINDEDLGKVHLYPSIKQFLNKPITSNMLSVLLAKE